MPVGAGLYLTSAESHQIEVQFYEVKYEEAQRSEQALTPLPSATIKKLYTFITSSYNIPTCQER